MKRRDVTRKTVNAKDYIGRAPRADEVGELIDEDTIFYEDGRPVLVYTHIPPALREAARGLVKRARYTRSTRSAGLPTQSAIFGALPRVTYRNNYCRFTANTREQPELLPTVRKIANAINRIYERHLPHAHEANRAVVEANVLEDYRVAPTPFTTVNLNVNHAIKYHRDTGNFKNVFSNVLILKRRCVGGFLTVPEFGVTFAQTDGALILFDGQNIIHGVTPVKLLDADGYRCSMVFYALESMKNCYPFAEELKRAQRWRHKVESRFRPDPMEMSAIKSDAVAKRKGRRVQ